MVKAVFNFMPEQVRTYFTQKADKMRSEKQHRVKQQVIRFYQKKYQYQILIETGTYLGDMVWAQKDIFNKIYSIELGEDLWKVAVNRFKNYPHITLLQGDSGKVLNDVVLHLDKEAIFWLDGHYSAGITAKGDKECPIFEELSAIFRSKLDHVLLIDDASLFNGSGDYPTIENLTVYVLANRPQSHIDVKDNIIRIALH